MTQYRLNWEKVLAERQYFSIQCSQLDLFVKVEASFLEEDIVKQDAKVAVRVSMNSSATNAISLSAVVVECDVERRKRSVVMADTAPLLQSFRKNITLEPQGKTSIIVVFDLSTANILKDQILWISRVCLELGDRHSKMFGQLDFNFDFPPLLTSTHLKSTFGSSALRIVASDGGLIADMSTTKVDCLVAEVAAATIMLKNTSGHRITNVRLDFKRNEQLSTEAVAVLFVDDNDELRSELTVAGPQIAETEELVSIPVRFSAQLVGNIDLELEISYQLPNENVRRTGRIHLFITAREPLTVNSSILSVNGLPLISILNYNDHVIKADISANANIIITRVEWLLADVVSPVGSESCARITEDCLTMGEEISYCCAVTINSAEEDVETPLGRLAVEWKRTDGVSTVRSVVPLCRVPLLQCPISIKGNLLDPRAATVRSPIRVAYSIRNHSKQAIELTTAFDLGDMFMFCGEKR
ncbi:hypothetical protein Angca_001151, partial [Angiostrongylus cantonensis]